MSVRKFMPENRLAKAVDDPAGMLVAHALQHADANLAKVRPQHLAALERKLDALRDAAPTIDTAHDHFYRLAREVAADSGALGLLHMSRAALSLCDLIVSNAPEPRRQAAIAVHVEALMALRIETGDRSQRDTLLAGLVRISGHTP